MAMVQKEQLWKKFVDADAVHACLSVLASWSLPSWAQSLVDQLLTPNKAEWARTVFQAFLDGDPECVERALREYPVFYPEDGETPPRVPNVLPARILPIRSLNHPSSRSEVRVNSSETLHRIFPAAVQWESDHFLREVDKSDKNNSNYSGTGSDESKERVYMLAFFDKSAGLFGDLNIDGGAKWTNKYFIEMVQDMERSRYLPFSPQMHTLKKHLRQVAKMEHLGERPYENLRTIAVGKTLATKTDDSHLSIKVFNSYHNLVTNVATRYRWPYIEWDNLPLEEVLSTPLTYFQDNEFLFSHSSKPHPPIGLPEHMKTKGQRIGSCSAFKFWLIARHDLETLPRFLEFSVALHLAFIEDMYEHFEARMQEWNAKIPRGWFAITRTPHFEGYLLKDIEDIKDIKGEEEMYQKLHDQIIHSVQRRYRKLYPQLLIWDDEMAVREFIPWKEKFLKEIPDDDDDDQKESGGLGKYLVEIK